jgi:hypothetical protein
VAIYADVLKTPVSCTTFFFTEIILSFKPSTNVISVSTVDFLSGILSSNDPVVFSLLTGSVHFVYLELVLRKYALKFSAAFSCRSIPHLNHGVHHRMVDRNALTEADRCYDSWQKNVITDCY